MSDVSAKAIPANVPEDRADQQDDSISFASLVRKLAAFTVVIFLFYLAVPLAEFNFSIVFALGIEGAWYQDIPVAISVAVINASIAMASFRLVR